MVNRSLTKWMVSHSACTYHWNANTMDSSFTVRWILSPTDHDRAGLIGTTTHPGRSPAAAALASAESVLNALTTDQFDAEYHVLSVSVGEAGANLLESNELQAALR